MKKIIRFQKCGGSFRSLGVKYAGGECLCDHDICKFVCGSCGLIGALAKNAWKSSGGVDHAIYVIPVEE